MTLTISSFTRVVSIAAALWGFAAPSRAATIVIGTVQDAVNGTPLTGASLQIMNGNRLLGSDLSDSSGQFRVTLDGASPTGSQNLKMIVKRGDDYVPVAIDVVVNSGRTAKPSYRVELVSVAVANCGSRPGRNVVVGFFTPPSGATQQLDLGSRIQRTLDYDVRARFGKEQFPLAMQPVVVACEQIKPTSSQEVVNLPKVLKADAFLSGYVARSTTPGSSKVRVEMQIADSFEVLNSPVDATTPEIDLDDPRRSRLDAGATAAIFTALVVGYQKFGTPNDCVRAANAAEASLGSLPAALVPIRAACRKATANAGLTRGSP